MPANSAKRCVVGRKIVGGSAVSGQDGIEPESLRRLHLPQAVAVHGPPPAPRRKLSTTGRAATAAGLTLKCVDHPSDHAGIDQRPRRVMDQHQPGLRVFQSLQTASNRLLPGRTTDYV